MTSYLASPESLHCLFYNSNWLVVSCQLSQKYSPLLSCLLLQMSGLLGDYGFIINDCEFFQKT